MAFSLAVQRTGSGAVTTYLRSPTREAAELALQEFAAAWDKTHHTISQLWRRNWERSTPFFAFPAQIRKVTYAANAVESLNMNLHEIMKTRGSFLNEKSAMCLLYLARRNQSKKWSTIQTLREALNRFQILWPERMPTGTQLMWNMWHCPTSAT